MPSFQGWRERSLRQNPESMLILIPAKQVQKWIPGSRAGKPARAPE
jgi:hypothetical protein